MARAHPELATELQDLLPTLQLLAALGETKSSGKASGDEARRDVAKAGQLLGDFRIIRELARGGMGVVFLAEQMSLGRQVALKVLPLAAKLDERQLERFLAEARTVAALQHEHIVPVYAVGSEVGLNYYAMQLITGRSLAEVIAQWKSQHAAGTALPIEARLRQAAQWTLQAAEALEYSHTQGIVHRDIKPANLLIDDAGKLWVADFGVARALVDCNLTLTGTLVGTPRYMSPEQTGGFQTGVGFATDIYSLGATLYELVALEPAYPGSDYSQLLVRIATDTPRPVRELERSTPRDLATIIDKAMRRDPAERYASAQHLADDLARFLHNEPIHAVPLSRLEKCVRWARKRKRAVTAALMVASVLILGGFAYARLVEQNYRLEGWRTVQITTSPPGAMLAIVPIDELTNEPNPDPAGIVRPEGRTPLSVDLKPGQYFIEAVLPAGDSGVELAEVRFKVEEWRQKTAAIEVGQRKPPINFTLTIEPTAEVTRGMVAVRIDRSLRMKNSLLPQAIFVDRNESTKLVSSEQSRKIDDRNGVSLQDAAKLLARIGKRLPSAAEYDAITLAVGQPNAARSAAAESAQIANLFGGAPEWTTTRYQINGGRKDNLSGPVDQLILKGDAPESSFPGLTRSVENFLLIFDYDESPHVAFRGVRSREPRFVIPASSP